MTPQKKRAITPVDARGEGGREGGGREEMSCCGGEEWKG